MRNHFQFALAAFMTMLLMNAAEASTKKAGGKTSSPVVSGVKIESIKSEWEIYDGIFTPRIDIKLRNVSGSSISDLKIQTVFLDTKKKEVFGEDTEYVVSSDSPLRAGYAKGAIIHSGKGFDSDMAAMNLPSLIAEISINGKLATTVKVSKTYNGMNLSQ